MAPTPAAERLEKMMRLRKHAAEFYASLGLETQTPNGDEQKFPDKRGNFSKSLPHDPTTGLVDTTAWNALFNNLSDLEPAPGSFNSYVDPVAGLAFDTQGPDARQLAMPPAPKFTSDQEIAEIAENYWMALLRDVPFNDYPGNALAIDAATHLSTLPGYAGTTTANLFRGPLEGENIGPFLSQFLTVDIPYGSEMIPATIEFGYGPGSDTMTTWAEYLAVENGQSFPGPGPAPAARRIQNGRDIANYVHIDELFQAYLNACLILITPAARKGFGGLVDQGNPYSGAVDTGSAIVPRHMNQVGFATLGEPNFKTITAEVATRALKQVWNQKWNVHRRLRPEAFGGILEAQRSGAISGFVSSGHITQLDPVLSRVFTANGTWLLPQAFPEGCPVHPAYGAGHATVAGACITVLKGIFYENARLVGDLGVTPMTTDAGGNLVPYTGADAAQMTVLSELNKLASNIGLARNIAGVHWRTDYTQSVVLGERIGLYLLQEWANTYHEDVTFSVRTFNRQNVTIAKGNWQKFPQYQL